MIQQTTSCFVQKEYIPQIKFPKEDVFLNKNQRIIRTYCLNRASQLGNLLKNKVNIYFKDAENKLMRVHTTIWAVTQNSVILKKGTIIPRHRIVYID